MFRITSVVVATPIIIMLEEQAWIGVFMFNMKQFADYISDKRRRLGLTQEQLSDLVGVTHQAVSKWERGEAMPEISKLGSLAKALGVQTDEIIANMYTETESMANVNQSGKADAEYYALADKSSVGDVYYLAPDLSKSVLREAINTIIETKGPRAASMLLQFADEEYLATVAAPMLRKGDLTLVEYLDEKSIKREVINLITSADLSPDRNFLLQSYQKAGMILIHSKDEVFINETFKHAVEATGNWNIWKGFINKFPPEVLITQGTDYMIRQSTSAFNAWWGLLGKRVIAKMMLGYADHFANNDQAWWDISIYLEHADRQIMESGIKERLLNCNPNVFAPLFPKLSDEMKKLLEEKGVKYKQPVNNNNRNNSYNFNFGNKSGRAGNFVDSIMNLGNLMENINSRFEELEGRIDDLEGRIDDIEDLSDQIEDIKDSFDDLKEALS